MTQTSFTVRDFMTEGAHTIDKNRTLAEAHEVMRARAVRHLPVLHGGDLVGMISQRDLAIIESLPDVDPGEVPVEDAMVPDTYAVSPDAPLRLVAETMADRKLGSAVVMEGKVVMGVFTTVDALRALARMLP